MKQLNAFIIEKLQLNSQSKAADVTLYKIIDILDLQPKNNIDNEIIKEIQKWLRSENIKRVDIYVDSLTYKYLIKHNIKEIDIESLKVDDNLTRTILAKHPTCIIKDNEGNYDGNYLFKDKDFMRLYKHLCYPYYDGFANFYIVTL